MFEQAILSNANASRAWTTGMGFLGEAALVAFTALVPIIWPEVLPKPQALLMLLTPPAPVAPPPSVAVRPRTAHAPLTPIPFTMPVAIPRSIVKFVEEAPTVAGAVPATGQATGGPNDLLTGILRTSIKAAPPIAVKAPDPKPAADSAVPKRIRTSTIELARLIHRVEPLYPPVAKLARVSGTVELTAVVGIDGHIRELQALSGNPLLIRAAIDAVSRWIYAPPVLNGERIEVIAPVTVNFRLDR